MNNLTTPKKGILFVLSCFGFILLFKNSSIDNLQLNYGFYGKALTTIPQSCILKGQIAYRSFMSEDPIYKEHYWITFTEPNCSNCVHHLFICNHEILGDQCEVIKNLSEGEFIEIKFSGQLKDFSQNVLTSTKATYQLINLTYIEIAVKDPSMNPLAS